MASPPAPAFPPTQRQWAGLERHYRRLDPQQLIDELSRLNALQQETARRGISDLLSARISDLDQPVLRSTPMAGPPPARNERASPPSPHQPSALDLLISRGKAGPRLAAKMVKAMAIAETRRNGSGRK